MEDFTYTAHPARVIFGSNTLDKLPSELAHLNISAPFIITNDRTISSSPTLQSLLSGSSSNGSSSPLSPTAIFKSARMHTPIEVTESALAQLQSTTPPTNGIVTIGGGSAIGLGKALAFRTGLPHLCVPTTYAGSEMTSVLGETADGKKVTKSDAKILPQTVVYDVELTVGMPAELTGPSGVNAVAHAVEALYAPGTNPVVQMLALEGVRALARALPVLVKGGLEDREARRDALYGTWLCSLVLGSTTMGLHHKLCHTLGGSFGLPHAQVHTIVLPHAWAYNEPGVEESVRKRLAEALPGSEGDAVKGLNELVEGCGFGGRGLKEFGFKEGEWEKAADIAVERPYANPRKVEREKIKEVIRRAWAGEKARADL